MSARLGCSGAAAARAFPPLDGGKDDDCVDWGRLEKLDREGLAMGIPQHMCMCNPGFSLVPIFWTMYLVRYVFLKCTDLYLFCTNFRGYFLICT